YIEAGAAGYILQNESVEEMMQKLVAAHEDRAIIAPTVAAALMERLSQLTNRQLPMSYIEARESQFGELTPREQEVLQLITQGCTNQEIANELVVECGTVKNHVHNILKKLEVNNRHEAASVYRIQQPVLATAV
ncbi:MAG: response regulator transcription factor, partial [Anaerolineales bacterium]|nr:response regulator transcription factor [Anaerolineales bacterium]